MIGLFKKIFDTHIILILSLFSQIFMPSRAGLIVPIGLYNCEQTEPQINNVAQREL